MTEKIIQSRAWCWSNIKQTLSSSKTSLRSPVNLVIVNKVLVNQIIVNLVIVNHFLQLFNPLVNIAITLDKSKIYE
jgi:hypothetical protein